MANIGAGRMIEFGWRPPNWQLFHALLAPNRDIDKLNFRRIRHLDSQGIRFFRLPRLSLLRETYLAFTDDKSLNESRRRFFFTRGAVDKGLLAIEFIKHGKRGNPMIGNEEVTTQSKFFLYRFPAGAVGLLRGLLHRVESLVIAYSATTTATTRSAILDRLVRCYQLYPDDRHLETSLKQEIRSLLYSSLPRPTLSTEGGPIHKSWTYLDSCRELDQIIQNHAGVGGNPYSPPTIARQSKGFGLFSRIINQAERDDPKLADGRKAAFVTGAEILPIGDGPREKLSGSAHTDNANESADEIYRDVRKSISANNKKIEQLGFTSSSKLRPQTLYNNIALVMWRALQGILFVPGRLNEWITERFRLVWLCQLDPIDVFEANYRARQSEDSYTHSKHDAGSADNKRMRVFVGSRHSSHVYPKLFSSVSTNNSIEVDLSGFFEFCDHLTPNGDTAHHSWLCNKIIETKRMHEELDRHFGYCSDFELSPLLDIGTRTQKAIRSLELLSTECIIKAILLHKGGASMLKDWCEDLMTKCSGYLYSNRAAHDQSANLDTSRMEIFLDTLGIAAAAIDCCRLSHMGKCPRESALVVHLLPSRVNECFYSRDQKHSPGTKEYDDNRMNPDDSDDYDPDKIGIALATCFAASPFDKDKAVDILFEWYLNDGIRFGESPEDLLNDISHELNQVPGADSGCKAHKDNLLRAFHQRLNSIG